MLQENFPVWTDARVQDMAEEVQTNRTWGVQDIAPEGLQCPDPQEITNETTLSHKLEKVAYNRQKDTARKHNSIRHVSPQIMRRTSRWAEMANTITLVARYFK